MAAGHQTNLLNSDVLSQAVAWRHELHRWPELAYEERRTADFVAARLHEFGLHVHRGLAGTGIVGTLRRGTGQRTIGIRAELDALPVHEESGVGYASRSPGVMHACGHDGHTAIALAAARLCSQLSGLDGTVHFIFQPAEEGAAGAERMVRDGLFSLFPCERIFSLHNWPALPVGACVVRDGAMMAARDSFEVIITGRGCHGAMPHQGVDPILAGCHLVVALQSVVSRNVDPLQSAVVSATQIHAGHTHNVIPEKCVVSGAVRWFDTQVGELVESRVREIATSIPQSFGCTGEVNYQRRYPATINNAEAASVVRHAISSPVMQGSLELVDSLPSMASEDFSFMLQETPGCYVWLGAGTLESVAGLHSPFYDFNDDLLPLGTTLWVSLVQHLLAPK